MGTPVMEETYQTPQLSCVEIIKKRTEHSDMTTMNPEYIEKIYAGWLAKVIGVRLGAPIEGWTYE